MSTLGKRYITEKVRSRGYRHSLARSAGSSKLYSIWRNMRQRCNNAKANGYPRYGGRGIAVCSDWNSFDAFRRWSLPQLHELSNKARRNVSIDRVDNDGHYQPSNCRLIDRVANAERTSRSPTNGRWTV